MSGLETGSEQPHDIAEVLARARTGKRKKSPWVVAALLFVTLLVAALTWFYSHSSLSYVTRAPQKADIVATVDATGTLQPTNQVEVGSEISGIVRNVYADYNDTVEAGAVLAKLDTDPLEAQVRSSRASLLAAQAALREAKVFAAEKKNELLRTNELFQRALVSQQSYDTVHFASVRAEAAVESALAQVEVRRASLAADQTRLTKAEIRSPISGVVIARSVEAGQTVAASFQTPVLFTLAEDLTRMELHLDIDEADVGQVEVGQPASFTVDAFVNRSFPGTIGSLRLAPQTIQGVVTYEALVDVANTDGALRPGMTATAKITTQRRSDVLQIPNSAMRFAPKDFNQPPATGDTVWVLRGDRPSPIEVSLGLSDGSWTEVLAGDIDLKSRLIVGTEKEQ